MATIGSTLNSNTTCDIYRSTNAPPANPDVAGVPIYLAPDYVGGAEHNESNQGNAWTHIASLAATTDIRDGYQGGPFLLVNPDNVYVPDKNGTKFKVILVVRKGRNTANDFKKVYLQRQTPTWPTQNI